MKDLDHNPLSVIDTLVRSLMLEGAILTAGLMIANPSAWTMKVAMLTLVLGFFSFLLTAQFLITIEMQEWSELTTATKKANSPRLAFPFLVGTIAYWVAGTMIALYFIMK